MQYLYIEFRVWTTDYTQNQKQHPQQESWTQVMIRKIRKLFQAIL